MASCSTNLELHWIGLHLPFGHSLAFTIWSFPSSDLRFMAESKRLFDWPAVAFMAAVAGIEDDAALSSAVAGLSF